jgi:hypothetical protein
VENVRRKGKEAFTPSLTTNARDFHHSFSMFCLSKGGGISCKRQLFSNMRHGYYHEISLQKYCEYVSLEGFDARNPLMSLLEC